MEIYYGNIAQEYLGALSEENIFTKYKNEFLVSSAPPNFLQSTTEVSQIIEIQKKAMDSTEWGSIKKFSLQWDGDIIDSFGKTLKKMNIPANDNYLEYLAETSKELGALVMQLKNEYQRARPYQIAYYSNLPLHPFETISGNTPAYPSGHACQGLFLCSLIANHYPEKTKELKMLANKIAESRIILGIHFPSDNAYGLYIAKELMAKEDIQQKYFLQEEE